jgi:pimeloyl-ACP methyl ester carboxylesterase
MSRTIVLVHGAWHGAWCWAPLQATLDAAGVPSLALDLPGHSTSPEPLGDLYGDGAAVGRLLDTVACDVVLVGHSYGGAVISEAVADRTNVSHLVYVAAFCLEVDESVLGFSRVQPDQDYALAKALVLIAGSGGPVPRRHASDCRHLGACRRIGIVVVAPSLWRPAQAW